MVFIGAETNIAMGWASFGKSLAIATFQQNKQERHLEETYSGCQGLA
jgi:hypothetical protein